MKSSATLHSLIILLVLKCQFAFANNASFPFTDTFHITNELLTHDLPDLSWIVAEGQEPLTLNDVRSGNIKDGAIIQIAEREVLDVFHSSNYWYRLLLMSEEALENQYLAIRYTGGNGPYAPTFHDVQVYFVEDDLLINRGVSGLGISKSDRDVDDVYYPSIVTFDMNENKGLEVWIKVNSQRNHPVVIKNSILSDKLDLKEFYKPESQWSFINGVLLVMLIIALFLVFWFGEKVYWWFLLFIGANILSQIPWGYSNQLIENFFSEYPTSINVLLLIGDLAKFTVTIFFARVFIGTARDFPKIDKLLIALPLILIFLSVLGEYNMVGAATLWGKISMIIAFITIGSIILIFGFFIFSGNKLARFYSIGAITPFIAIFVVISSGRFGYDRVEYLAGIFIGLGPILALGLAMVYRFKVVVEDKLSAEEKSREILYNQNEMLESQVKERTNELEISLKELNSTQAQLIQSEKMASLGELTAGIAHEIQNPLNFVNNFSDVSGELLHEVKEEIEKGDKEEALVILDDLQSNLDKINHHGARASSIVKGMLDHSRESNGKKEKTDINALCEEYIQLSYHGFRSKDQDFNVEIEKHLDVNLPRINVISQDIGRVLLNVFNNAFYACAERSRSAVQQKDLTGLQDLSGLEFAPKVKVKTEQIEDSVLISISDNGIGMSKDTLDKVFQPFYTTKPTGQGTGLGMSISYDIITKGHGGSIAADSEEEEGSVFVITLPYADK